METLTLDDLYLIRESLQHTIRNFENCTDYPSYEFKQAQISEARAVLNKVRAQIREAKQCNSTK